MKESIIGGKHFLNDSVKISYFCQFYNNVWTCEHSARAPAQGLLYLELERRGKGSLSLNQVLKDKWNLAKHRKKGKIVQAEVTIGFSTQVWQGMECSGKCQPFRVAGGEGGEGEVEDSADERGVRNTVDFILRAGESHQRVINRGDRSLDLCLRFTWGLPWRELGGRTEVTASILLFQSIFIAISH